MDRWCCAVQRGSAPYLALCTSHTHKHTHTSKCVRSPHSKDKLLDPSERSQQMIPLETVFYPSPPLSRAQVDWNVTVRRELPADVS